MGENPNCVECHLDQPALSYLLGALKLPWPAPSPIPTHFFSKPSPSQTFCPCPLLPPPRTLPQLRGFPIFDLSDKGWHQAGILLLFGPHL